MANSAVTYVHDNEFDTLVSKNDKLVLIDFMAPWCAPCTQMAPIIEDVAREFGGELFVCKMDVDQDPETAKKLGVRGLPTLLVMKQGEELHRETGTLTKTRLAALIENHLP